MSVPRATTLSTGDVAVGVLLLDLDGTIRHANPVARTMLSAGDDPAGRRLSDLLQESSARLVASRPWIEGGGGTAPRDWEGEVVVTRDDGSPFEMRIAVRPAEQSPPHALVATLRDIQDEVLQQRLLDAIVGALSGVTGGQDHREVFEHLLGQLLNLTKSAYGFIGEVLADDEGRYLKTHAITDISWNDESRRFFEANAPAGLEFRNTDTLFGAVLETGEPIISNRPAHDSRAGGIPEVHPPLDSFLGLPIHAGGEFVGVVGIANRAGGYTEEFARHLDPLLAACGSVLAGVRVRQAQMRSEAALRESEARNRAIFDRAADAIVTVDAQGTIEHVNPATTRIFGYDPEEVTGAKVEVLMPEHAAGDDGAAIERYLMAGDRGVVGSGHQITGRRKNGTTFPMELGVSHVSVSGRSMFTAIIRDVTERVRGATELEKLNRDLRARVTELDGLNRMNEALNRMAGFLQAAESVDEVYTLLATFGRELFEAESGAFYAVGEHGLLERMLAWGEHTPAADMNRADCWAMRIGHPHTSSVTGPQITCRHVTSPATHSVCVPVDTRDGSLGLLTVSGTAVADQHGSEPRWSRNATALRAVASRFGTALCDIKLRTRLHEQSTRDPLTRLHNRRFFDEALAVARHRSARDGSPLSVVMVDVDHFKRINDAHGHEAGDDVLVALAGALRANCRAGDIPSRVGGEEFAILLADCAKDVAVRRADRIRETVAGMDVAHKETALRVTISCGVATIPEDADEPSECLARADHALYQAKHRGRNRVEAVP